MRTVILGAGGLGGVFAGMLAAAGAEVTLIARPAQADVIRRDGLSITGAAERIGVGLRATADPAEVREADLFVLAVKAYDTAAALEAVSHLRGRTGTALSLQNGLTKDEALARALGADPDLPGRSAPGAGESPGISRMADAHHSMSGAGHFPRRVLECTTVTARWSSSVIRPRPWVLGGGPSIAAPGA